VYNESIGYVTLNGMAWLQPVIMYIIICGWLFFPANVLAGQARYWFLSSLARITLAPFFPVSFTDFWLADQLNSLADFLFLSQFIFCMYMPTVNDMSFCTSTMTLSVPVLNMFPFYARMMQCLRRFRDTKKAHPHLTNAGKYFSSIVATTFAFIDTRIVSPGCT